MNLVDATNHRQSLASKPTISVWASANAGAGKTKVLIDRIARLLLAGADPGRILAVTYTKAAAAEMQNRLFTVLGSWTIATDRALQQALEALDPELGGAGAAQLARARALFAKALETPGGLKIQTIHAFCQAVLQRFPLEAGVPPGFKVLDDAAANQLTRTAFDRAAHAHPDIFDQLALLTAQESDRDLLSKVRAEVEALADMRAAPDTPRARLLRGLNVREGETRASIQADMMARLDRPALSRAAAFLAGQTGDKNKALVPILHILATSTNPETCWDGLKNITLTQDGNVIARAVYTTDLAEKHPWLVDLLGRGKSELGAMRSAFVEALDRANRVEVARVSDIFTQAVLAYDDAWRSAKSAMGALDFEDLLARAADLLSAQDGSAQWVLYKLDAGIEHILIDEAQDTNPQQWKLLTPLFKALESEARDRPRTRFIVGDEKQSIYSFQGARPERFLEERADFERAREAVQDGRESLTFDLSFRTGQTILSAVDAVWHFSRVEGQAGHDAPPDAPPDALPGAPDLEAKYAFPIRHIAFRQGQTGAVELWSIAEAGPKGPVPEAWDHPRDMERSHHAVAVLAERIAQELRHRLDTGFTIHGGKDGAGRTMTPGDVMILVRSRGKLFHQIIRRLKANRVPVAGADRMTLIDDTAIQDLVAIGRFALLPEDDFNTACVLKGAFCGLVDDNAHLFPLAHDRGHTRLWERLRRSEVPAHQEVARFLSGVANRAGHLPPFEFFAALLEQPTPQGPTGWHALCARLGQEIREPTEMLLNNALSRQGGQSADLLSFLHAIEADDNELKREMEQGAPGVRVMTVHGAKGLEAPVVILPETTTQPKKQSDSVCFAPELACSLWVPPGFDDIELTRELKEKAKQAAEREDARLRYVAMTRARDLLILCGHHYGKPGAKLVAGCWYEAFKNHLPALGPCEIVQRRDFTIQKWGAYAGPAQDMGEAPTVTLGPLPDWLSRPAPPEAPGQRRIAPSALAPDGSEPPVLSPLAKDARHRFLRGRLIHELLERLPEVPSETWADKAHARLARETDVSEEAKVEIVAETLAVLHDPRFAPLFGPNSRAEAALVGRGVGLPDDLVVNGSVDRLVVTDQDVLVLDFKTNRPPPLRVEDVAPVYLNQMAAYRALLQANWPGKTVRCALLWTDGPRLMELPDAVLDEALREIAALPR